MREKLPLVAAVCRFGFTRSCKIFVLAAFCFSFKQAKSCCSSHDFVSFNSGSSRQFGRFSSAFSPRSSCPIPKRGAGLSSQPPPAADGPSNTTVPANTFPGRRRATGEPEYPMVTDRTRRRELFHLGPDGARAPRRLFFSLGTATVAVERLCLTLPQVETPLRRPRGFGAVGRSLRRW